MSRLKELEKRLKDEPDNLGVRVMLASAMRDAGRQTEAVELYRSVAVMYRDQGRTQQAVAVCRSILELVPDDVRCHALLATLAAGNPVAPADPPAPQARTGNTGPLPPPERTGNTGRLPPQARTGNTGPLPPPERTGNTGPLPDGEVRAKTGDMIPPPPELPTLRPRRSNTPASIPSIISARSSPAASPERGGLSSARAKPPTAPPPAADGVPERRSSSFDQTPLPGPLPYHVADPTMRSMRVMKRPSEIDLPVAEDVPTRTGSDDGLLPELSGFANAARRISASLIAATDPDEDVSIEIETHQLERVEPPALDEPELDEDALTPPPDAVPRLRDDGDEEELTRPREMPGDIPQRRAPGPGSGHGPLASAFFSPLPLERRAAVLSRFQRKSAHAGATVIRHGELGHPLILIASGRLEVRAERTDGKVVQLAALGAGEYVGEAALLARTPAPAHVIALTDVELLLLQPRDFYEIAGAFPALWAELKDVAERRTRDHEARLRR